MKQARLQLGLTGFVPVGGKTLAGAVLLARAKLIRTNVERDSTDSLTSARQPLGITGKLPSVYDSRLLSRSLVACVEAAS